MVVVRVQSFQRNREHEKKRAVESLDSESHGLKIRRVGGRWKSARAPLVLAFIVAFAVDNSNLIAWTFLGTSNLHNHLLTLLPERPPTGPLQGTPDGGPLLVMGAFF